MSQFKRTKSQHTKLLRKEQILTLCLKMKTKQKLDAQTGEDVQTCFKGRKQQ